MRIKCFHAESPRSEYRRRYVRSIIAVESVYGQFGGNYYCILKVFLPIRLWTYLVAYKRLTCRYTNIGFIRQYVIIRLFSIILTNSAPCLASANRSVVKAHTATFNHGHGPTPHHIRITASDSKYYGQKWVLRCNKTMEIYSACSTTYKKLRCFSNKEMTIFLVVKPSITAGEWGT